EVVQKGQKVTCQVLNVDQERKRVALGLKQMANDPWEGDIPARYHPGDVKKGKVTKLTNFGVFVELEPGLEGLLHISELTEGKVESPEDVVKVGDEIEVKVLRVDAKDRKIGLSRKNLHGGPESVADHQEPEEEAQSPTKPAREKELRGGTGAAPGRPSACPGAGGGGGGGRAPAGGKSARGGCFAPRRCINCAGGPSADAATNLWRRAGPASLRFASRPPRCPCPGWAPRVGAAGSRTSQVDPAAFPLVDPD